MSDIIIIGAGIAGLSSAYYLQKQGHQVRILDKGTIIGNCSYGNAGMIVPSHFIPLATPGMLQQGVRWMFNSKSPFYVRPSLNGNLIDWGLKFMKHANHQHVARSAAPLRDLSLLSKQLFADLSKETDFEFELRNKGILAFYKTEKAAEEEAHVVKEARALGLDMAILNAEECKALQPKLDLDVLGAAHYRCDGHIFPPALMNALISYLESNGVEILRNHEVDAVLKEGKKITGLMANGIKWVADQYVLAAGAWSPALAKMTGLKVSIMPGKGYSFMEPEPGQRMSIPALLCEARVAITPMNGQIRYGGTMELDKINDRINQQRVRGIIESVPKYFPDLKPKLPASEEIWYGFRPSSPDGLPYIGRAGKTDNLIVATGHGMMGLSLGPATGLLVSQLLSGQKTEIDIAAFSPLRFN
jgi:D-amino-acid dehydrogenase